MRFHLATTSSSDVALGDDVVNGVAEGRAAAAWAAVAARYVSHAQLRLQIIAPCIPARLPRRAIAAHGSLALCMRRPKLAPARKRKRVARHFYKEMEFANATTEAQVAQQDKLLSFFETLRVTNEVAIDGIVEWLLADTPVAVVILVYGPVASGKTAFTRPH